MSVHAPSVLLALWLIAWSSLRAQPQEVALTWIAGHEAELHVAPCRAGTAPSRLWLTRSMGEPFGDWEEPCPDLSPAGPSRFRFKVPAVTTPTTFRFGAWEASGEQGPCQGSLEVWPPLRVRATLEAADAGRRCLVPGSLARLRARRVDGEAWRRCTWVLLGAPPTALLAHGDEALFTAPPVTRPTCFRIQVRDSAHPEDLAELGLPVVPDPDALPWRRAKTRLPAVLGPDAAPVPTLSHLAGATGFGRDDLLPRFQGPRALGFIQDPSMGALDRHWLVGDPDGLKAVPARGGSVATLAATRVGVSAIAARPPGADPGAPWPVVFAQPQEPPEVPGPARWPGEERGSCLRVLGTDGQVRTLAGALQENPREPRFRDGPADEARFGRVVGLAMDASGAVFVADAGNAMLRRLGPDGRVTTLSMQGFEALPEPGADAEILPTLTGLGVDPATGDLLVSDSTCLYRYTQAGLCTPLFSPDDEADGAARRSRRRPSYGLQRLTGLTVFGDYVLLTMQGPIPIWAFHLPTGRRAPLLGWDQPRTRLGPLRSCAPGLAPEACAALDRPCALAVNAEGACALALEGGLAHLDLAAALGVLFPP